MTKEIHDKEEVIKKNKHGLEKIKTELQQKDNFLKSLEDSDNEEDDGDYSTEESDNEANSMNTRDNKRRKKVVLDILVRPLKQEKAWRRRLNP